MKALVFKAINEKCLEDCPKPTIQLPTDAIVKITKTTLCGTDTFSRAADSKALKVIIEV